MSPREATPTDRTLGGGDTFANATVIPSLPFTDSGSTTGSTDDYAPPCAFGGSPDVVYRYSPETDTCITISLCGSGFDTALHLYQDSEAGYVACNDDYCGDGPQQSKLRSVALEAGHDYYIVVDGFWFSQGAYTLSVTTDCPAPCVVACPPDAIQEGEADICSATGTNDGCNLPMPAYTDLACGPTPVTVCGTYGSASDASARDTDWYRLVVSQRSHVTVCGVGEATTNMTLVDLSGGCGSEVVLASGIAEPCDEQCLEADINPGTGVLVVSSIFARDIPCGKKYTFTVTCEPLTLADVHCNDASGNNLSSGQNAVARGVVTSNFPAGSSSRFTIQDVGGGLKVVCVSPTCLLATYCGTLGDEVEVQGSLIQVAGLLQLRPSVITPLSTGNPQPDPVVLTPAEVNASFQPDHCEPNESRLVRVDTVTIVSSGGQPLPEGSTFAANGTYGLRAKDASLCPMQIVQSFPNGCSLHNPLVGMTIPAGEVNVTGILSQNDASSPYKSGYLVQPRDAGDIVPSQSTAVEDGPAVNLAISLPYPNPAGGTVTFGLSLPKAGQVDAAVFDLGGREIAQIASAWFNEGRHVLQWDGLMSSRKPAPSGIYFLRVAAAGRTLEQRFVVVR